ncbi:excalibur calcium-binding domain-containing protein [Mycobacterium nebraskense]|nr:excalibur calcium-binding domain-containing protein [Mycobacterium nebraskense]
MADPPDLNCTQVNNEGGCVYKNCTDAKAHGRCNIPRGDQAYCPSQDRDGDGLACEC